MKTNKELGAVYLEVDGLDKERFKELTNGMEFWDSSYYNFKYSFIENFDMNNGYMWYKTDMPDPNSKLITLDELEQLLKPNKDMKIEEWKLYLIDGDLYKSINGEQLFMNSNGIHTNIPINSLDVSNKIAVYCHTKEDKIYVLKSYGLDFSDKNLSNYNKYNLISLEYSYHFQSLDFYNSNDYKIISIDQFKQFYPENKKDMKIDDVVVISREDYQRFVELESKEKNKPKFSLVYCMQSSGDWFKATYEEWESKENIKVLHNVFYNGISYKLLVIDDSHIFLGKEI